MCDRLHLRQGSWTNAVSAPRPQSRTRGAGRESGTASMNIETVEGSSENVGLRFMGFLEELLFGEINDHGIEIYTGAPDIEVTSRAPTGLTLRRGMVGKD